MIGWNKYVHVYKIVWSLKINKDIQHYTQHIYIKNIYIHTIQYIIIYKLMIGLHNHSLNHPNIC